MTSHALRHFCFVLAALALSVDAHAFTVSSAVADGCHEQITEEALRNVRGSLTTARTIAADANEQALIDDLPFILPADMKDLAATSLLIGVRDNDLKGRSPTELDQLAAVHGDPNHQEEHCLRAPTDTEPSGSASALARCSSFIYERALYAATALDASGAPDASIRDDVPVNLALRGDVTASLPAFWVRIGQALHALQDSFAHAYRTTDGKRVTVVLNWVKLVEKQEVESRDGPPHKMDLDHCNAGDDLRARNRARAVEASTALLSAVLDPSLTSDAKKTAVESVLATYLMYSPGCGADNAWCDAPENAYTSTSGCGCDLVERRNGSMATLGLVVAMLAALVCVRARKRRRVLAAGAALVTCLVTLPAHADQTSEAKKEAIHESHPIAIAASFDGSIVDPAVAASLGVRFAVSPKFVLGLDAELNAWYGVNGSRFDLGAASLYATGILRFPMRFERINLRTTFNLGASYELVGLYGVPSGSFGFFVGLYPLGLEFRLSGHVFVIFNPLGVGIPIPHLTGVPFGYPQFRSQLGVEIAF